MNMKSLKMPRQLTLCIFIFSSVGNLAGKFVGGHILAMCTKPLIVPSLALFCWLLLKENDVRGCKVATLMLAMAFGALGTERNVLKELSRHLRCKGTFQDSQPDRTQ